jgi:hypothetical protein
MKDEVIHDPPVMIVSLAIVGIAIFIVGVLSRTN